MEGCWLHVAASDLQQQVRAWMCKASVLLVAGRMQCNTKEG